MNILVLGGAGFIGYHLVNRLKQEHYVLVVDNLSRGVIQGIRGVKFIWYDLTDTPHSYTFQAHVMSREWDQVYHLAAMVGVPNIENEPLKTLQVNAGAMLNTLKIRTKQFFLASTSEVYGQPAKIPTPETSVISIPDITSPRASYAASKIFAESLVVNSGLPFVIGRFHNVYGPRMGWDHVVPRFCQQVIERKTPLMVHNHYTQRAFCYIDDAVEAIILAMDAFQNEIVNIGNDQEEINMHALMRKVARVGGHEAPIEETNGRDWIHRRCPDLTKLYTQTKYRPTVFLDQGLPIVYEWYKKNAT